MFEQQESTPWYRSLIALIVAAVLLPPLGLVLVWMRRDLNIQKKALVSFCIVALMAGYVFLFTTARQRSYDDRYAELERHRAAQQQQAAQNGSTSAANAGQPGTADGQNQQQPGQTA